MLAYRGRCRRRLCVGRFSERKNRPRENPIVSPTVTGSREELVGELAGPREGVLMSSEVVDREAAAWPIRGRSEILSAVGLALTFVAATRLPFARIGPVEADEWQFVASDGGRVAPGAPHLVPGGGPGDRDAGRRSLSGPGGPRHARERPGPGEPLVVAPGPGPSFDGGGLHAGRGSGPAVLVAGGDGGQLHDDPAGRVVPAGRGLSRLASPEGLAPLRVGRRAGAGDGLSRGHRHITCCRSSA